MSEPDAVNLKTLLSSAKALLRPPQPLPSSPPALLERLRSSSELLPSWRTKPGWGEDDELDEIGDDDDSDKDKRKARRDALVKLVGKRSLDIVVGMQEWLEKEFWPLEARGGLDAKEFLLGTADLRLLRLLLAHAVASYLLSLTTEYIAGLPSRAPANPAFPECVQTLLGLLVVKPPPGASSSSHSTPPTTITTTLISVHLTPIVLASVTLAWTPTVPPPTYAAIRTQLLSVLGELSPTQSLGALGTALKFVQAGKNRPPKAWVRRYPAYVEGALSALMSGQLQRPGGVRGIIENVLGEAGNMVGPEAVDAQKLDQVVGLLARAPRGVPEEQYIPALMERLMELVAPESAAHPVVFTHAAAYIVYQLWYTNAVARGWLDRHLHDPFLNPGPGDGVLVPPNQVARNVQAPGQLVLHAPPNTDFVDFVMRPILPPLFALYDALSPSGASIEKAKTTGLLEDVSTLLTSWGKLAAEIDGVAGLWSIVTGGRGWPPSEDGTQLVWRPEGDSAALVRGYPAELEAGMDVDEPVRLSAGGEDLGEDALLNQLNLAPNPARFAQFLKRLDRRDLSSAILLKVLNEWRARYAAGTDPLESLLYLKLTLEMIETLGSDKIMTDTGNVLAFVEAVLGDEAKAVKPAGGAGAGAEEKKPKGPLIQEIDDGDGDAKMDGGDGDDEELPELTEEGVAQLGLVETSISLLIAALEKDEKLNHATSRILHPINDHLEVLSESSPSSSVRRLAREALLLLLLRRSQALSVGDSSDSKISRDVSDSKSETSSTRATYQRALTLLSDPIVPVRAHGLQLLADLTKSPDYDPALTPGIMDAFMGAIQDTDSYIYLHAVTGLVEMCNNLGAPIFRSLVNAYRPPGEISGDRLDKALRVGEALGMVIERSGKAFAANADAIVPRLTRMYPDVSLPTVLRSSALSLLSTAVESSHLALLPWMDEMVSGCLDLIQLESVSGGKSAPEPQEEEMKTTTLREKLNPKIQLVDDEEVEEEKKPEPEKPRIVDAEPTKANDSKHPALRRAAVYLLGLVVAALIEAAMEEPQQETEFKMRLPGQTDISADIRPSGQKQQVDAGAINPRTIDRAINILRYVASVDDDDVVRGQSAEVVALLERLKMVQVTKGIASGSRPLLM